MDTDKIVVGLDIGTTKICAMVGRKNEYGKLEILGTGKAVSDGVIRGIVINIDKTTKAIEQAISEAEEQSGININVVNVGIAGQHINSMVTHNGITRKTTDEEITVDDVLRLTEEQYRTVIAPGSEIIHVMPQDYIVDYEDGIKEPVGMSGVRLEADFHIITAQTNAINNINKCVKRAGLETDNLILEPIASSMSVLSDEEKEAGVCLVDIGGGTTDVAIFYDGIIRHTAVIPFGGNILTSQVLNNQAESLKTKFGVAIAEQAKPNEIIAIPGLRNRPPKEISVKNLAHIIEARMEEIIEHVHAEIINSGYEGNLAGGIVLTGGGSQLQYPNEHLGKSTSDIKSPMYATSIGLVLSGFMDIDDRQNTYEELTSSTRGEENSATDNAKSFVQKILAKTKGLLIDDMGDGDY